MIGGGVAEAGDPREIPELDLNDLPMALYRGVGSRLARTENVVATEWPRRIPDFELAPGYRPLLPLRIPATAAS
ncbi:hypothetical protein A5787_08245 [Mycobacterium sp. 852002-50816_SCH5313054-b]|nr:hypothetical protein A5787_08245 [Mycobacterium sp. 852002-50816_SCH5313054-b]